MDEPPPQRTWKLLGGIGAAVVVLAAIIGGWFYWHSHRPVQLGEKETIVIADFVNTTDDAVFDGSLIARETCQENRGFGDIFHGSELAVDCFPQHDVFDNFLFSYPKLLRLLGDLFLDQRGSNKAGANDV